MYAIKHIISSVVKVFFWVIVYLLRMSFRHFAVRGLIKSNCEGDTQSSFLMSPFDVIGSAMSPYVGGSTYRGR